MSAKTRHVFVNSLSDLFHADVPDEFIAKVFAVMAECPHHTFQLLTKRHARMRALLTSPDWPRLVEDAACDLPNVAGVRLLEDHSWTMREPLPNVWLGVSVEDQHWADIRIPHLLETPAAVRFISAEPLLGPVDLRVHLAGYCPEHDFAGGFCVQRRHPGVQHLGWVITGGESGPNARPIDPDWVRTIRDQCAAARVPFFHKQWGGIRPKSGGRLLDGIEHNGMPEAAS